MTNCYNCGERLIEGDYVYRINGVLYCENCIEDDFREVYNEPDEF